MYKFKTKMGEKLQTSFSPTEIKKKLYCFDALDTHGENVIIRTCDVNFKTFLNTKINNSRKRSGYKK